MSSGEFIFRAPRPASRHFPARAGAQKLTPPGAGRPPG